MQQKRKLRRKLLSFLITLVMVASLFGGISFSTITVNAAEEDSAQNTWTSGDCTVTYDSNTKTMTVTGNGAMGSYESEAQVPWKDIIEKSVKKIVIDEGVTSIGENVFYNCDSVKEIYISSTVRNIKNYAFFNDSMDSSKVYFTRPSVDCELQIDGMPFNLDYWTLNYSGDGKYVLYDKNIDLENASSVTKLIGNWEDDGAGGIIYTTKIFTWKIPTSSITCISEHGVVTASVGGTDVTTAEVGDEVTLKVKPDLGYQLKSITATFPKDGVETFDDLVGLMGDAVINGDTKFNQFGEYTCKVENGQFAIYNGNDLVSRTSDITDFQVRDNGYTIIFNSGNLGWLFRLDRDTGNIIGISVNYISDYNSAFESADNSKSTGTIPPNEISLTTVKEGSDYKFIMPKRNVTVTIVTADSSDSGSSSSPSSSSDNTNTNTDTSAKVPYDDVAISTGSVNDITGTAEATAESNPFETKIENNSDLTTLLSLTDEEVAQGVNVWLDIQDMSATVPQADKDLVQNASTNLTVGMYLDINLFKKVGDNTATKITETNGTVKASILIPESLWKAGRTFEIIRVHDGVATAIAGTYDENTHVFTFETDKFSTYALAYKDLASSSGSDTTSDSGSSDSSNSTHPTTPKTGDSNDIKVWYLLLIASLGGLGFLGLSKKKKVNE